ncbi:hypothetical protein KY334_00880 [Candidatus Woesearchaeota archaeon]|nr:hypothetical protein [Candidatus Woesearchaeota archaeon]
MPIIFSKDLIESIELNKAINELLENRQLNVDLKCTNFIKDDLHGFSLLFIGEESYDLRQVFYSKKDDLFVVYYCVGNSEPSKKFFKEINEVASFIIDFLVYGKLSRFDIIFRYVYNTLILGNQNKKV